LDEDGDLRLKLASGRASWPGIQGHDFAVIAPAPAPAPASANETPAARVARLCNELKQKQSELEHAQAELDKVSPAFPEGWCMRDGVANGSDGEEIRISGSMLRIDDSDGDQVAINLIAVRAFLARLG
jgi:hypothetical protein